MRYTRIAFLFIVFLYGPPAKSEVMLGAHVPYDGWSIAKIAEINNHSSKNLAFINFFSSFSHKWDWHIKHQANNIFSQDAMPMISWMPIDTSRKSINILAEITQGQWDSYLTEWGTGLKSWINSKPASSNPSVMIRFGHEFNGKWYSYANDPSQFIAAWQYIHNHFESLSINKHIQWVWCPNYIDVDDYSDFTRYYPGDNYVDWTALDGYNWGSNYSFSSWKSFTDTFTNGYNTLVNNYPSKPIMIGESGTAEPLDTPSIGAGQDGDDSDANESKALWIQNMLSDLPQFFPAVRALNIFNMNKELGWSLYGTTQQNINNTGLENWNTGISSGHYTTDFISVLNN